VGGVNDWLVDIVTGGEGTDISAIVPCSPVEGPPYLAWKLTKGHEEGGYGRIVSLPREISIDQLIERIKRGLNLEKRKYPDLTD